jgi:hypothetical protein
MLASAGNTIVHDIIGYAASDIVATRNSTDCCTTLYPTRESNQLLARSRLISIFLSAKLR